MTLAAEQTYAPEPVDLDTRPGADSPAPRSGATGRAGGEAALAQKAAGRHCLVFEFALLNLAASALLAAAYMQGWIGTILAADGTA